MAIGPWQIIIIVLAIIILFGGKKIPEIARGIGLGLKEFKKATKEIKDEVWNRDNGQCVDCSSQKDLEFDHIIPVAKGGANTYRNLQLLCEDCNRSKSDNIG